MIDPYEVLCEQCGCTGNQSCGHEPLDKDLLCTILQDDDTCGCCAIDPQHMRYDDPRQTVLEGLG